MKFGFGGFWKTVKIGIGLEQALEKSGIIPQNKVDDKIKTVIDNVDTEVVDKLKK